ncbi:MAG: OmpA family protein [Pseudoruegeria sp.]
MTKLMKPIALAAASSLVLAACTDPAYLNSTGENTDKGVIYGGIVGGLAGLATAGSDPAKSAAIGAVAGAAAGGLIGAQLDKQEAELRQTLTNGDIQIINTGSELKVIMPQGILFASDSAVVNSGIYGDMSALASNLNQNPDSVVEVIGHTDNTGEAAYNLSLSQQRATSVSTLLINNGVSSSRVVPIGKGEDEPVASNLTEEGKAQNRRVEIIIRPTV